MRNTKGIFKIVLERELTGSVVRVQVEAYTTLNAEVEARREESLLPGFSWVRIHEIVDSNT